MKATVKRALLLLFSESKKILKIDSKMLNILERKNLMPRTYELPWIIAWLFEHSNQLK